MARTNQKKKKRNRRIIIITLIIGVALLLIGGSQGWFSEKSTNRVSTSIIKPQDIVQTVSANGKIQPETEVKISPDVSGEIVELNIKEGDFVKEGDFLLKIKPDIYESYLERADAALNSAKANLANTRARSEQVMAQFKQTQLNFERNKKLFQQGAISQADFENIQASYEMGQADVNAARESVRSAEFSILSAKASVKEASENLKKTVVYAPISGTVSMLNIEIGERVVGTEMMAGTEMLRIANLDLMEVIVDVNENDIIKVNLADTAEIEVDAYLNRIFKGIVTEIANSATNTGNAADQVTNFKVKIRMLPSSYADLERDDKLSPLRPGMSANVDIRTEQALNILTAPIQAVTVREDTANNNQSLSMDISDSNEKEMKEVVFVYKDGMVYQRFVKTGIQDTKFIEIKEGIEEGEEIVSSPFNLISKILRDKMAVEKVPVHELYQSF